MAFQFTPLREGRRKRGETTMVCTAIFQFTPLREGRRCKSSRLRGDEGISIHAPPRGATRTGKSAKRLCNFNSRPSARGDMTRNAGMRLSSYFNSRPSARGDKVGTDYLAEKRLFQFTPLREGRPFRRGERGDGVVFQFTPLREGRRAWMGEEALEDLISIHAPPRGATDCGSWWCMSPGYFNSRPSARGDLMCAGLSASHCISIHAPPRGATAKDMQFLQIFCSTLTNQHGLTIVPRNLSRLFW